MSISIEKLEKMYQSRLASALESRAIEISEFASEFCQSPIEELFFFSWWTVLESSLITGGTDYGEPYARDVIQKNTASPSLDEILKQKHEHKVFAGRFSTETLDRHDFRFGQLDLVFPQCQIGKHRVDFALLRMSDGPCAGERAVAGPLIIECDGKDFHDRNVEQLRRDRSRDRELQLEGHSVLRFTGSELYRNGIKCAEQADEWLQNERARMYRAARS